MIMACNNNIPNSNNSTNTNNVNPPSQTNTNGQTMIAPPSANNNMDSSDALSLALALRQQEAMAKLAAAGIGGGGALAGLGAAPAPSTNLLAAAAANAGFGNPAAAAAGLGAGGANAQDLLNAVHLQRLALEQQQQQQQLQQPVAALGSMLDEEKRTQLILQLAGSQLQPQHQLSIAEASALNQFLRPPPAAPSASPDFVSLMLLRQAAANQQPAATTTAAPVSLTGGNGSILGEAARSTPPPPIESSKPPSLVVTSTTEAAKTAVDGNTSTTKPRGVSAQDLKKCSFPEKVYYMLTELEDETIGEDTNAAGGSTAVIGSQVIAFVADGTAFMIHQPRIFETDVMPMYFSSNRMSSFQRQLNIYGFERVEKGPWRGAYRHKDFQKGHPELLKQIVRSKLSSSKKSSAAKKSAKET